jgi:hypothetical protein
MILTHTDEWDSEALNAVIAYRGGPKQVWDNTIIESPWLSVMRNALNDPTGAFSPGANSITILQDRGVVFMACHNAIWEFTAARINPDELSHEALAAELTNPRRCVEPWV